MAKKKLQEIIEVPEGVHVSGDKSSLEFKGPKGTVQRGFENPKIALELKGREIVLSTEGGRTEKAVILAYRAHIKNAFNGVRDSFIYKLKICSGHFPMNVSVANNVLLIKNFLGEKIPRKVELKKGVNVKVDGNLIIIEGNNKELTGQVAADIEQATRRPRFDRRIFQDGIYIIEKAGKPI